MRLVGCGGVDDSFGLTWSSLEREREGACDAQQCVGVRSAFCIVSKPPFFVLIPEKLLSCCPGADRNRPLRETFERSGNRNDRYTRSRVLLIGTRECAVDPVKK